MRSPFPNSSRCRIALALLAVGAAGPACAFTVSLTPGTRALYLDVGNGSYSGTYTSGGTPQNNSTINVVSVTVPAASVGNGVAQAMTSNSTQSISYYDGFSFCSPPAQVYIGGFYRQPGLVGSASLTATAPASLTNASGDTIAFNKISWTSTGAGDSGAEVIPAGTFTGGTQTLATFGNNSWNESCHTFSYANNVTPGAGTYTGRVLYTLSAP
ncbi:MAG TPA: hypothetical protein VGC55_12715 [Dokdonella sp.]